MISSYNEFSKNNTAENLVVFIHGFGANGADLLSLAPYFDDVVPNAHFIAPNAPKTLPYGPESYSWYDLESFEEEYLFEGIKSVENILEDFIETQAERLNININNVILVGFSQGTLLSIHHALRAKNKYKAVIGFSGGCLENKIQDKLNNKLPICLIHGADDEVLPSTYTEQAETALNKNNIPTKKLIIPHLAHSIDKTALEFARTFLKELN